MKTYNFLGKAFTALATGIIGFTLAGPILIIPFALAGILSATLLQQNLQIPFEETE